MSGPFCATGSACGANLLSCGYELAIVSLGGSRYDCQAKVAETPMQKIIRKRTRAGKARLPRNDHPFGRLSFSKSAGGRVGASTVANSRRQSSENSDCVGLDVALICTSHVPSGAASLP